MGACHEKVLSMKNIENEAPDPGHAESEPI